MTHQLRPYQREASVRIRALVRSGIRHPLLVMPTGTGKTEVYLDLATLALESGSTTLILAPQKELVEQPSRKLDARGIDHGIIMADHWRRRPWLPLQIASVHTLARRETSFDPALVICDEAHMFVAPMFRRVVELWPNAVIVGCTATARRLDGRSLDLFDEIVEPITIGQAITEDWLVPIRTFSVGEPDLSEVDVANGEFNQVQLQRAAIKPERIGGIVETWLGRTATPAGRGRPTLLFAAGIDDSKQLVEAFRREGVRAVHLDGDTQPAIRSQYLRDLASGAIEILSSAQVLRQGVDIPEVSCIIDGGSTLSVSLFLQKCGRGLRPAPGKQDLLLLDHAGNVMRHGYVEWRRKWSLKGTVRCRATDRAPGIRTCTGCFAVSPATARACVSCSREFPVVARTITERPGTLQALGGAARAFYGRHANPEQRARTLAKWIAQGRERGWKPNAAYARFFRVFGLHVDEETRRAAERLAAEAAA